MASLWPAEAKTRIPKQGEHDEGATNHSVRYLSAEHASALPQVRPQDSCPLALSCCRKRARMLPSRPTRNLLKFQMISPANSVSLDVAKQGHEHGWSRESVIDNHEQKEEGVHYNSDNRSTSKKAPTFAHLQMPVFVIIIPTSMRFEGCHAHALFTKSIPPIQAPILNRLSHMRRLDIFALPQIGDGPRHFQNSIIRPRA